MNLVKNFLFLGLIVASVPLIAAPKQKTLEEQLILAIEQNKIVEAEQLLNKGADVQAKDENNRPALTIAAISGNVEICKLLIKHNANVDAFCPHICDKACMKHSEYLNRLGQHVVFPTTLTQYQSTALLEAVRHGHEEIVALLLAHGAKIHDLNLELSTAAEKGYYNICKLLIDHGASVNCTNKHITSIGAGYKNRYLQMVSDKSKISADEKYRATPLIIAAENGHLAICKLLIKHGADIHAVGTVQRHWLDSAMEQSSWGHERTSAFTAAAKRGHTEICILLIKAKIIKFFKRS